MMSGMGKILVLVGIVIVVIGTVIWLAGDKISWFGNLPGDIRVEKENFKFYFPVTSMILLSVVISFLWWVIRKLF